MKITAKFGLSAILLLLLVSAPGVFAQGYELGLLVGRLKTGDRSLNSTAPFTAVFDGALTYQANFAKRMVDGKVASLHCEFLLTGAPKTNIKSSNVFLPRIYSSLFITPGVKVKLLPSGSISPYVASGLGYGRYSASETLANGQPNTGDRGKNSLTFNFGGGLDFNVLGLITLRGEVRDFVTGNPRFNTSFLTNKQHNVFVAGGIVLRF
jgi:opacity protein-like surface antigen